MTASLTELEVAAALHSQYGVEPGRALELARKALADQMAASIAEQRERGFRALDAAARGAASKVTMASPSGIVTRESRAVLREWALLAGGGARIELEVAPRTKKNGRKGGFAGIKQGPAYRRYRDAIVNAFAELRATKQIPLAERPYNIAVRYYVDRHGERADKCGLDQGLYDALENAGVVTNDWQFRTDDGTRIVFGDPRPRVEIEITPTQED